MKTRLAMFYGKTRAFKAKFVRYGTRPTYTGSKKPVRTMLVKDLEFTNGEIVADHIWVRDLTEFSHLGVLESGDVLRFKARVDCFPKGSYDLDFHVVDFDKVRKAKPKKIKKAS